MFALVEVFGGIFAVLLFVYFLIVTVAGGGAARALPPSNDAGEYRMSWPGNGSGWVVLVYPDRVVIPETGEATFAGALCEPVSGYVRYIRQVYVGREEAFVYALLDGGVSTMVEARDCLISMFPGQAVPVSTLVADQEFLKIVAAGEIPPHLKRVLRQRAGATP
jgi:hypothetical protein